MSRVKGIVIAGPTGIGKTDLAVMLAQRLDGELISCDSVQVFKDLTVGANKTPTPVPQHLLDVVDWRDPYTAADYYRDCHKCIKEVVSRGKVPILVGGAGFYLDWILNGRPSAPATDPTAMAALEEEMKDDGGWDKSFQRLVKVDPEYAQVILPNDYYRLKRALVVHKMTGKPLSSFKARKDDDAEDVDWRCFYMTISDRETLLKHIDHRCEGMIAKGLLEEVAELRGKGLHQQCQAGRSIGYKEALDFLDRLSTISPEDENAADEAFLDMIEAFQSETRKYTKRQEKWFQAMEQFHWIQRPSLQEDLSPSLIDQLASWYEMPEDGIIEECRRFKGVYMMDKAGERTRKRLRSYETQLKIYDKRTHRLSLIEQLGKVLQDQNQNQQNQKENQ